MKIDRRDRVRQMADEIFENGSAASDVRSALAELGDDGKEFLERLAVRASMQAGAAHSAFDSVPAAISEALVASYDAQRNNIGRADVSAPATWMAAKAWFGNDVQFIMKLAGRQVSAPSHRFLRDAADALGVGIDRLKEHFALAGNPALAGVERKASGRQTGPDVEPFDDAVNASKLPDEIKKRWLKR